ncbi:MAG: 4Fe-4S binding protein [Bacillota bacterium]|nr:4Fe-4S binding protein [Bacillota bacterium]MDW7684491.1 4Fe-4S binding protein [Bacillota bacterium]
MIAIMYEKTGVVSNEMLEGILPSRERREKGPYAVFECFQQIPCNPCFTACRAKAVDLSPDINSIPRVDYDKCSGCSLCVSACPGLACFIIDETYSDNEGTVKIPYEFLPLPAKGQEVTALDREGNAVARVTVIHVQSHAKLDCTNVVTVAVPKELLWSVRNIGMGEG